MAKESASMEVTRIAREYIKQGHTVYTLSVGDTHFNLPDSIQKKLTTALANGKTHYLDSLGLPELRKTISEHEFLQAYQPDEIIIVPGVKQGLYYFLKATTAKKIALIEPAWLGYHSICELCDKEIIRINAHHQDWMKELEKVDFDCLLLCTPNNPDGKIYTAEEMEKIYAIVSSKKALLLIDEIYALYSFDRDVKKIVSPYYRQKNVITFSGFSKAYAATGLRIGYVATHDAALLKSINIIHQNTATCANSLAQFAFHDYTQALKEVDKYAVYYKNNRDLICKLFPDLQPFKPAGGFYFFIDLKKFGIENSDEFCKELLEQKKIALVPGSAYGEGFDTWVRLSYSIDEKDLEQGVLILKDYLQQVSRS
jgi:aspartate/methionine/tyrosine aminotransferase